jgi:hypothetical protein
MGYVIAAYAVAIGAVALYFAHLVRERARLRRSLAERAVEPGIRAFRD